MPKEKAITDEGLFDDEKAQIKKFFILFSDEKIDGLQVLSGIFIIVSKRETMNEKAWKDFEEACRDGGCDNPVEVAFCVKEKYEKEKYKI